jgi:hypothetical protein
MAYKNFILTCTKALVFLTSAWLILLAGCKKTQEVQTHWSAGPVKVDGEITEWNDIPTNYFEESGVGLGLCNDTEKLYILFRFNNAQWAQAIRMSGLTLWLDNSGKKKKDFGIRYTGGPSLPDQEKLGGPSGGFQESLTPEQQQRLAEMEREMADKITFIDKKGNRETTLGTDGSGGPAVCFDSLGGIYAYEISIPLQKGDAFDCAIGAKPGQTVCLGLEWGGMGDRQRMRQGMGGGMGPPPGGGPPGGGGGMPPGGGGMGGGPPGGGKGGSGMQQPEKQEVWVKTKLASPPAEQE